MNSLRQNPLIDSTGTAANSYLYTGEQFDDSLNHYYLRARYYYHSLGRFTAQDTWMGSNHEPVTLHKYLYANADPVNNIDPSGNFSIGSLMSAVNTMATLVNTAQTIRSVFEIASSDGTGSAKEIGSTVLLSLLPGASGIKLLKMSNLKKKVHGNSLKSQKKHHVYQIDDRTQMDIYKYGISGGKLNKNGTSRRANRQANKLNRPLSFIRYIPKVLFTNIPGRVAALAIEYNLVCNIYLKQKGRKPDGNDRPVCNK